MNKVFRLLRTQHLSVVGEYLLLSMLVFYPIFKKGHILLLDYLSVPNAPLDRFLSPNPVSGFVYWILNNALVGKIGFVFVLAALGLGAHYLVQEQTTTHERWGAYFAGLLVMFNPWVYSRFLYGQLSVLIAAACLPWFLLFLFRLVRIAEDSGKIATKQSFFIAGMMAVLTSIIAAFALYGLFFIALTLSVVFIVYLFFGCIKRGVRSFWPTALRFVGLLGLLVGIFVVLNTYWLIPFAIGHSAISHLLTTIGDIDILSFPTATDAHYGTFLNSAALYGFWGDREGRYASLKDMVPYWLWLYGVIALLAMWGIVSVFIKQKKEHVTTAAWSVVAFFIIGATSLVLAVGVAHPSVAPFAWWLYRHVPFYQGFREPQKWIILLLLAYAYFGALGVGDLLVRIKHFTEVQQTRMRRYQTKMGRSVVSALGIFKKMAPALLLAVPLLYGPGMLGGFKGQLCVNKYPPNWFKVNDFLKKDPDQFTTLFLPWHLYMGFSFSCGRVISNPAERFFAKPVLAGDNMEMGVIYSQSVRSESKYIENTILNGREKFEEVTHTLDKNRNFQEQLGDNVRTSLGDALLPLSIKYVILAQESDFFSYSFIAHSPDMELVYDLPDIKVYRNREWGKR